MPVARTHTGGALLLVALLSAPAPAAEDLAALVDRLAAPYVDSETVVGMTVGVLRGDERAVRGFGHFAADDSRVPDGKTVFEIGSISKVFTGLLLADAVVQGRVTLNTPVNELLPKGVALKSRGDQPVTLWRLSTHTAGLPKLPDNLQPADPDNPYADYDGKRLAEFLNTYEPRKRPGEVIEYSNLGVGLLGLVLARDQKRDYEALLKERIAGPWGLDDTVITLDDELRGRLAPPHLDGGAPGHNWDIDVLAGAGAIRSTTDDLLDFARAHLDPQEGPLRDAIALAWCLHQKPIEAGDAAMGLGWHFAGDGSTRWHSGETGGYHSALFVNRKLNVATVVLTNTATDEVDQLAVQLLQALAGAPVEPRKMEQRSRVAPEVMERYAGKYRFAPGIDLTVAVEGGKMTAMLTGQQPLPVLPRSATEWFCELVDATLTFQIDGAGEPTAVELFQNGQRQVATRLAPGEDKPPGAVDVPAEALRRCVGVYRFAPGLDLTVAKSGAGLTVQLTGQQPLPIAPRSETEWFCTVVDATLTFKVNRRGKATAVELFQNGRRQVAKRVE